MPSKYHSLKLSLILFSVSGGPDSYRASRQTGRYGGKEARTDDQVGQAVGRGLKHFGQAHFEHLFKPTPEKYTVHHTPL